MLNFRSEEGQRRNAWANIGGRRYLIEYPAWVLLTRAMTGNAGLLLRIRSRPVVRYVEFVVIAILDVFAFDAAAPSWDAQRQQPLSDENFVPRKWCCTGTLRSALGSNMTTTSTCRMADVGSFLGAGSLHHACMKYYADGGACYFDHGARQLGGNDPSAIRQCIALLFLPLRVHTTRNGMWRGRADASSSGALLVDRDLVSTKRIGFDFDDAVLTLLLAEPSSWVAATTRWPLTDSVLLLLLPPLPPPPPPPPRHSRLVLRRRCHSCLPSHRDIYYVRLTLFPLRTSPLRFSSRHLGFVRAQPLPRRL